MVLLTLHTYCSSLLTYQGVIIAIFSSNEAAKLLTAVIDGLLAHPLQEPAVPKSILSRDMVLCIFVHVFLNVLWRPRHGKNSGYWLWGETFIFL